MRRALTLSACLCLIGLPPAWAQDAGSSGDAGLAGGDAGVPAASADAGPIVVPDHMVPQPDAPNVVAGIADGTVEVGRAFSLFVTITHDDGVEVNIPSSIVMGGAFEEVRRTYTDSTAVDGRKVREYEIQLMAWFVGEQMLSPVEVIYVVRGEAHKTQSSPVPINVVGVIGEGEEKLRDIAPPVGVNRADWTLLYVGGAGLAIILVILLTILVMRRRRRTPRRRAHVAASSSLPLAPDARALARLEALEASGSLSNDDKKPGYLELSEIVREYLGSRFGFAALDSTTSEIKSHIGRRPDGAPALEILAVWLDEVDLVKYASYQPSEDETGHALGQARALIARCAATPEHGMARAPTPAPELDAATSASALAAAAAHRESPPHEQDAGDTLRGMPAAGRGASRWEPPRDYLVPDPRATQVTSSPVMDAEPETPRDPEPAGDGGDLA